MCVCVCVCILYDSRVCLSDLPSLESSVLRVKDKIKCEVCEEGRRTPATVITQFESSPRVQSTSAVGLMVKALASQLGGPVRSRPGQTETFKMGTLIAASLPVSVYCDLVGCEIFPVWQQAFNCLCSFVSI